MDSLYLIVLAVADGAQAFYIFACRRSLAVYRWQLADREHQLRSLQSPHPRPQH